MGGKGIKGSLHVSSLKRLSVGEIGWRIRVRGLMRSMFMLW